MPPGPSNDQARWVWVWVVQNDTNTAAAARGGAVGPFVNNWQVPLTSVSDPFIPNRRARAMAVALIEDGSGQQESYWWSERIWIRP